MIVRGGNLLDEVPSALADEQITDLFAPPGVRIERIVSTGQASPPGFWYDQPQDEWVCVLAGSAGLLIAGDWLELPAHVRHRVAWTDAAQPTVWLAVHVDRRGG